jgi:hypothetical protein
MRPAVVVDESERWLYLMLDLRGNLRHLVLVFCLSAHPCSSLSTEQNWARSIVTRFLSKFAAVKSLTSSKPLTSSTFSGLSANLDTQTYSTLKALASLRHANLGSFLDPENIKSMSGGHLELHQSKRAPLNWYEAQMARLLRPRCIRTKRDRTQTQINQTLHFQGTTLYSSKYEHSFHVQTCKPFTPNFLKINVILPSTSRSPKRLCTFAIFPTPVTRHFHSTQRTFFHPPFPPS